ncbi:hydrolase [Ktedonobacter sp. SOSP1-85]|uniref:amidohydrolase family protein n=1 Tax=Ktedonobacter sp. SOSP1-85 TaxID=2778367 RepID=UPI001915B1B7|nr:amidohydrolase family protein [Ktedonobacter sp. SOSP1-85]GHO73239.1 hydrolase [Ktedonobacter sp. SOSP1-85]
MLDLNTIPIIDNHCHPFLLQQRMDAQTFRGYFSEATHPSFAQKHVSHSIYYLWFLRQAAAFYGCKPLEDEIIAARSRFDTADQVHRLFAGAHIEALVLDSAYPPPTTCYAPEQIASQGGVRITTLLRLEILMQDLIQAHTDFDEVVARYRETVRQARELGYSGLKSIVAYRTGLEIAEWSKDEAVAAFTEARAQATQHGELRLMHKPLLDYLLHQAFEQAAEQELPVQFHTGYGDGDTDMRLGNPLHLRAIFERGDYQRMPIVLLHESYPYVQLGAYLAAIYPNVYFDLSYTIPFVEKLEMLTFTRQALSIAPASKLTYSSDGINVPEMLWVGAKRVRTILAQVLQEMIDADELDTSQAQHLARLILHDNAAQLYFKT